jgi:hypothetical protein
LSLSLPVRYGAQGSVLSPLLFISYVIDVLHLTRDKTILYADNTSILNIGQDINKLQITISENTVPVEQCVEANNLSINPTQIHDILFQTKHCRQKCELKILTKNRETINVNSTNFLEAITSSNLSWELAVSYL